MLIKKANDIPSSEITPKRVYMNRRNFLAGAAAAGAVALAARPVARWLGSGPVMAAGQKLEGLIKSPYSTTEKMTPYDDVTTYNNYYEFGTAKSDPARYAQNYKTSPWTVSLEGEVMKPQTLGVEDILKMAPPEERIYRLRCVEGWSIVVPWVGFPLSVLIDRVQPTSKAKYVQFFTDLDPQQMPALGRSGLDWPYREGLRMDEAMHPLTILCFGLYGEVLPNQNGAPIRVIIPWKYGFKSGKSIVRFRFMEQQPDTTWNTAFAREYGFYSNVNPEVNHPRWSQATERRLGEFLKRKTLMFNGYADQVASLYAGMDLRTNY